MKSDRGRGVRTLSHPDEVWSVVFSPDGQHVLTAGGSLLGDGEAARATVWNLDGTKHRIFPRHGNWVLRAAYSPSGLAGAPVLI